MMLLEPDLEGVDFLSLFWFFSFKNMFFHDSQKNFFLRQWFSECMHLGLGNLEGVRGGDAERQAGGKMDMPRKSLALGHLVPKAGVQLSRYLTLGTMSAHSQLLFVHI